jgi:hypothetical protein
MDALGNITGLVSILSSSGIAATRTIAESQHQPSLLHSLADNTVLRGIVQGRGANNTFTVKTEQGMLTLQTDVHLKRGAEIAIKIEQRLNESLVRIVSINGQSLNKYLETGQETETLDEVAANSQFISRTITQGERPSIVTDVLIEDTPLHTLLRGVFLSKPVVTPETQQTLSPALQTPLIQASIGTSLQIRVLSIQVPSPDGDGYMPLSPNAASAPPALSTHTSFSSGGYGAQAQRMATTPLVQVALQNQQSALSDVHLLEEATPSPLPLPSSAATRPISVSVLADVPPSIISPPIVSSTSLSVPTSTPVIASSSALTATVISNDHPRELTVQSDIGTFKLFVITPLPKGTLLQFDIEQVAQVRVVAIPVALEEMLKAAIPHHFEAMEEVADLQHYPANLINSNPPHIIPRAGASLTAEIVFLMAALKGGDARKWFGEENLSRIESKGMTEKGELLSRLTSEFASLKTIPEQINDGVWRHVLIPIYAEGEVRPVQYFFKKQQHKDKITGDKQTDHFMVDVELTRLGRMQLDGLVQKQRGKIQFDLIIRSEQAWEEGIRSTIREIYQRAQDITGMTGMVTFRHGDNALIPLPIDNPTSNPLNANSIMV